MKICSYLKINIAVILASFLMLSNFPIASAHEPNMQTGIFTIPPWGMKDADGNLSGITVDMLDAIGKQTQISLSHNYLPFKRMVALLERGEIDISAFYKDDLIPSDAVIPISFLHDDNVVVVGRKGIEINSLDDLKGLYVAQPRGAHYLPEFDNDPLIYKVFTDGHDQSVRMFLNSRVDAIAGSARAIEVTLRKSGASLSEIGKSYFIAKHEVWVHVSKTSVDTLTINKIRAGVEKLKSTGEFERILEKYYN